MRALAAALLAGLVAVSLASAAPPARWQRAPQMPGPRHGLGVVALKGRVFAIAGGTAPGLTVSGANEILDLSR